MVSTISEFDPTKQAVILFGAASLYTVYKLQLFNLKAYNDLSLAFSIIAFLWFITILIRWLFYTEQISNKVNKLPKIKMPYKIKCCIKTNKCEDGDLNIWSVIHFITYLIVGYFIPNHYIAILYISIVCELIEIGTGDTSKLILDPITNLTGYTIGSYLSPYNY